MAITQQSHRQTRRVSPLVWRTRALALAVVLVLVVIATFLFQAYLSRSRLNWSIEHGLVLLADAPRMDYPELLKRWQADTERYWRERRDALITRLFTQHDLTDPRITAMLERASGANYGDRKEDWEQWYETRQSLAEGRQPNVNRRQRIEIDPSWVTGIGRTAWFSSILPIDRAIYISTLGETVAEVEDEWDGVVRVDGLTGEAEMIFKSPDRWPRDVVGLASSGDGLFVAVRNGFVYSIDFDGNKKVQGYAVSRIVSVPLALDVNDDSVRDCVVVTEVGKVVAISGKTGRTPWVTDLPGGPPTKSDPAPMVHATLSSGDFYSSRGDEIVVVTESGDVVVLSARSGQVLDQHGVTSGVYGGAVTFNAASNGQAAAVFGDGAGQIWAFIRERNRLVPKLMQSLAIQRFDAIGGDLRTLEPPDRSATWLVATQTGRLGEWPGSVTLLDGGLNIRWRHPPGGEIWSAPAIADINADGVSELIVTSVDRDENNREIGRVTILSPEGHCLRQLTLDAGVEAPPVVADVNGTGRLEILVADRAGKLHCYAIPGYGRVEWGVAGGDSRNTRNAENAFKWGQLMPEMQKEF